MSDPTPILLRTIDGLVASSMICQLFVWDEEPSKFSYARIHRRSEHYCVASIFDVDGSYEGIRCIRLEDLHRLAFDNSRCRFVQSLPFLERDLAAEFAKPFIDANDLVSFLYAVKEMGQACELMDDDMESLIATVLDVDEWSVLISPLDEDSRTFDGKVLIDLDRIRYPWACTKRTRLLP